MVDATRVERKLRNSNGFAYFVAVDYSHLEGARCRAYTTRRQEMPSQRKSSGRYPDCISKEPYKSSRFVHSGSATFVRTVQPFAAEPGSCGQTWSGGLLREHAHERRHALLSLFQLHAVIGQYWAICWT